MIIVVLSVQSLSRVWLFVILWTAAWQAFLSITNSQSQPKLKSIESVMPYNHLILCRPLLLPPSIFPSIRSFPMNQFFTSGGQSFGISASASDLPMNIQDWFPLGWTGWISFQSKGLSRVFYSQFSSISQSCLALCDPMNHSMPGLPVHHQLPEFTQTRESVMPSSHLILCHPLLLLPPIPPSIRVFSNESALRIRWPTYWSFGFDISPSNEHPRLISFRMDWLDLLAVQGTLKSLLQHHSSKASILQRSAFFTVHLSHPYMTTEDTIALTRRIFVGKVMSLLLNMLSRLVITLLLRSKHLLIS